MKDAHPIYNAEEERGQKITELAGTYEADEMIERIRSASELDWAEALGEMDGIQLASLNNAAERNDLITIGALVLNQFKKHYKSEIEDAAQARAEKEAE